jgi:hypothetical protein
MFVRFGKAEAVTKAKAMLAEFDPRIEESDGMVTVYAPDGDIVFQAIPKDGTNFILRYHREVFSESE